MFKHRRIETEKKINNNITLRLRLLKFIVVFSQPSRPRRRCGPSSSYSQIVVFSFPFISQPPAAETAAVFRNTISFARQQSLPPASSPISRDLLLSIYNFILYRYLYAYVCSSSSSTPHRRCCRQITVFFSYIINNNYYHLTLYSSSCSAFIPTHARRIHTYCTQSPVTLYYCFSFLLQNALVIVVVVIVADTLWWLIIDNIIILLFRWIRQPRAIQQSSSPLCSTAVHARHIVNSFVVHRSEAFNLPRTQFRSALMIHPYGIYFMQWPSMKYR